MLWERGGVVNRGLEVNAGGAPIGTAGACRYVHLSSESTTGSSVSHDSAPNKYLIVTFSLGLVTGTLHLDIKREYK